MPRSGLPSETLTEIILYALATRMQSASRSKRVWMSIKGFTLASKVFREIALQVWFSVVELKRPQDWDWASPKGESSPARTLLPRARHLVGYQPRSDISGDVVLTMTNLHSVTYTTTGAHDPFLARLLNSLPTSLREMTLHGVPYISDRMLSSLSKRFRSLETLRLTSKMITYVLPGIFEDGTDFGNAYGTALQQLTSLKTLSLDLFLVKSNYRLSHTKNHPQTTEPKLPIQCELCRMENEQETVISERSAVIALGSKLESLKRVEWGSWIMASNGQPTKSVWVKKGEYKELSGWSHDS